MSFSSSSEENFAAISSTSLVLSVSSSESENSGILVALVWFSSTGSLLAIEDGANLGGISFGGPDSNAAFSGVSVGDTGFGCNCGGLGGLEGIE